jgi:DNA-binding PadR family transcriptional regulator
MSTTRLLVLGAVRIFQPVHGYFLRRELLTWRADQWAALNPGSVYNALKTLTKDGFLEEVEGERTSYRLTVDGELEFQVLLREALWSVEPHEPSRLLAGLAFMLSLTREEVIAALESRIAQIEAAQKATPFTIASFQGDPNKPAHVAEHLRLTDARMQGEASWARALVERLRAGEYEFDNER